MDDSHEATREPAKSKGHMFFTRTHEFYEDGGQVYRAWITNPVDIDGCRVGRWECSRVHFDTHESKERWIAEGVTG